LPRQIGKFTAAHFSPDQNSLIITGLIEGMHPGDKYTLELKIFDFQTGKLSVVPSSEGKLGGQWITQDTIVASIQGATKLMTFDFKTQQWSDLIAGNFVNWTVSPDGKYLVFTTGGTESKVQRLRFADRRIESIADLKDLRRVVDSVAIDGVQVNVAPDGSPVFTRDIGTQEIYALSIRWP
jgi:hypothetical protein